MKTADLTADLTNIQKVVRDYHFVSDRVEKLREMGYIVEQKPMGSGGVMQVKELKCETRIQVGYGQGKHNYAYVVILKK